MSLKDTNLKIDSDYYTLIKQPSSWVTPRNDPSEWSRMSPILPCNGTFLVPKCWGEQWMVDNVGIARHTKDGGSI